MDRETIESVEKTIMDAAEKNGINLDKLIVFGSRARDDYTEKSDVDLLIVSQDFRGVQWNERPEPFYEEWSYEKLPAPEFICLTPEEFEEKREERLHIVKEAVEEGVRLA